MLPGTVHKQMCVCSVYKSGAFTHGTHGTGTCGTVPVFSDSITIKLL